MRREVHLLDIYERGDRLTTYGGIVAVDESLIMPLDMPLAPSVKTSLPIEANSDEYQESNRENSTLQEVHRKYSNRNRNEQKTRDQFQDILSSLVHDSQPPLCLRRTLRWNSYYAIRGVSEYLFELCGPAAKLKVYNSEIAASGRLLSADYGVRSMYNDLRRESAQLCPNEP